VPLHPFIARTMEQARPALSAGSPADARTLVSGGRAALGMGPQVQDVFKFELPGREGPIPARLYVSDREQVQGLLVYVHGGGWVCGSLDDFDLLTRALAVRTRCAVLAIDYRLAPEHRFPCGLNDVEDALEWAGRERLQRFGRAVPLVVAGDSAGANLALVALANLRGRVDAALQCLFYPVADSDFERPSYLRHGEGLPLTRQDMLWFLEHYVDASHWEDPRIAPLRNGNLAGCPPTWIAVAEYDVLHDEGVALARELERCGVPVDLREVRGLAHGFVRMFNLLPEADQILDAAATKIRAACATHS